MYQLLKINKSTLVVYAFKLVNIFVEDIEMHKFCQCREDFL